MPSRRGLSLMEVLISLVIFLGALVVIGRLILIGGERALEVKYEALATQLCQAKMAEVVAGAVPLQSQSRVAFADDPAWSWSLEVEAGDLPGLWRVQVRVEREERPELRKIECTLSQLVIDPAWRGGNGTAPLPLGSDGATASATAEEQTSSAPSSPPASRGPPPQGGPTDQGPPRGDGLRPPFGNDKGSPRGGKQ